MDTITHGIAGALIGKAFFAPEGAPGGVADPSLKTLGRTAILGATLGSIFPDSDTFVVTFSHNDLGIIQYHRYVTHSWVCLPVFAILLALLVGAFARWRGWRSPSMLALTAICGIGIASHILLDLITSFGTMAWSPLSEARPAWDLVFILDFTLTGIVLVPQLLAWIYRAPQRSMQSFWVVSVSLWLAFSALAEAALWIAPRLYFSYSPVMAVLGPILLAVVFFVPHWREFGYRIRRATWCRAGLGALAAYLLICIVAHSAALARVRQFATQNGVQVESLAALPVAPSANYWDGLIRTSSGVYEGQFPLLDLHGSASPASLRFFPDSAPDKWIEAARQLPQMRIYLWFARFPVFRSFARDGNHFVEVSDLRFTTRNRGPAPFRFRVTFDENGRAVFAGFIRRGI
jgi:inner membrane protein